MAKQSDLIGDHPGPDNIFGRWLAVNDIPATTTKCHRTLSEIIPSTTEELIDWLSNQIIKYHFPEERIEQLKKLKAKFDALNYSEYVDENTMLPSPDVVMKGNATEVILSEYLISSTRRDLIKLFRFRYNSNVDQSLKGDDALLVDYIEDSDSIKVYLGEAKFRGKSSKQSVDAISNALQKDKLPLSYTLLKNILMANPETREKGQKLDEFLIKAVKSDGNLNYVGLLLSDIEASTRVEDHLDNDNPNLVFISVGIDNPSEFIRQAFEKANEKINNPESL